MLDTIISLVRAKDFRISLHGYEELADDNLTVDEVINGIADARIIEEYPNYPKGPSILILQYDQSGNAIHVVWGILRGHVRPAVLITAYRPDPAMWDKTFSKRVAK